MKILGRGLLAVTVIAGVGAWIWLSWLEQSFESPYALVEEGLYVGSSVAAPPPGTKAVLNLCGQEDLYVVETRLWEPVLEGGPEPNLEWLGRMVDFVAAQRRAGKTTYVHCLAGMNRSGTVTIAYLMDEHDWTRDKALAFVQQKRPQVQPNPTFMRLLAEWEKARPRR